MNQALTPDELVSALTETCQQLTEETAQAVEDGIEKIVREAAKELRQTSPEKTGKYRKSWRVNVEKSRGLTEVTAYASGKSYRLTHLLENGHVSRDGTTRVRAIPHIAPVNEAAQEKAEKLLQEVANGT